MVLRRSASPCVREAERSQVEVVAVVVAAAAEKNLSYKWARQERPNCLEERAEAVDWAETGMEETSASLGNDASKGGPSLQPDNQLKPST